MFQQVLAVGQAFDKVDEGDGAVALGCRKGGVVAELLQFAEGEMPVGADSLFQTFDVGLAEVIGVGGTAGNESALVFLPDGQGLVGAFGEVVGVAGDRSVFHCDEGVAVNLGSVAFQMEFVGKVEDF